MKVLRVHNFYRLHGGEDLGIRRSIETFRCAGVDVQLYEKDSGDLADSLPAKVRAVFSAVYSPTSKREVAARIAELRPDILHVHNLYPLVSPSVLCASREAGIPVVMHVHNYRLVCPTGLHLHAGEICERCAGGREYWCLWKNCRGNLFESAAYAFRNIATRKLGLFLDNVDAFIAVSTFVRDWLIETGVPEDRVYAVPNSVSIPEEAADAGQGDYAAFAGRMSEEKGVATLVDAARHKPTIPLRLAGGGPLLDELRRSAPGNAEFMGLCEPSQLGAFYRGARFAVVPSACHEPFGRVTAEAMSHGVPVIVTRVGASPELVDDGVTGVLVEPGDVEALAREMDRLWGDPDLCARMGRAARAKAIREYSDVTHIERVMAVYEHVMGAGREAGRARSG